MIPEFLKPYFWDVDTNKLDLEKHRGYIIARILEKGRIECLKWMFKNYNSSEVKTIIVNSRNVSDNTRDMWLAIL